MQIPINVTTQIIVVVTLKKGVKKNTKVKLLCLELTIDHPGLKS